MYDATVVLCSNRNKFRSCFYCAVLQFQQMMLIHRAQKRLQNSLSEISPHLAAISSSCISVPGHNQGDEVSPDEKGGEEGVCTVAKQLRGGVFCRATYALLYI